MPNIETPHEERLQSLERLAHGMDRAFRLPVIGARVGWDSILGLVPGVGDALALAPAGIYRTVRLPYGRLNRHACADGRQYRR
ncbi:DUF4112 domain-containing protein [Phaeobacter sp. BS52]|uniref:DUF4112 domain-containing protein n=1 Tax=Phaeobacter sp. BS52 TaxID=2907241 RepID=UPI00386DABF0